MINSNENQMICKDLQREYHCRKGHRETEQKLHVFELLCRTESEKIRLTRDGVASKYYEVMIRLYSV